MFERICTNCGIVFTVKKLRQAPLTCSLECRYQRRDNALVENRNQKMQRAVIVPCSVCGKEMRVPQCRLATKKTCSRKCHGATVISRLAGVKMNSKTVECSFCGKPVTKPVCRVDTYDNSFCNNTCYHAWDKEYKKTPKMLAKGAERAMTLLANKSSKQEFVVAQWLDDHGIEYEWQHRFKYWNIDFKCIASNVYVEVNGCYWHGCPMCFPSITPRQKDRRSRDAGKNTYFAKHNLKLLTIWEHDIRRLDFSALSVLLN